ncbi:MAG: MarR family transcriptional regulator [Solirubrobacterales bacterium]|nr:MarR family transcriptional regulator [Solirubrobacterales bacterium]
MSAPSDEVLAAWRSFLTAHALITRRISQELTAEDLPDLGWYDVLWALYRQPKRRLRINELAREVVLSPTAMSRFVDRLEQAGVVRREAVPSDRRAFHIVITEEGIALLRRMWPTYAAGIGRYFAPCVEDNVAVARSMFERIAAAARSDGHASAAMRDSR